MRKRIVFVNLHANEMLVKTSSKYIYKLSVAIKHKYLLDYLLAHPEYELCTYINKRGFSLLHYGPEWLVKFFNIFRFAEHRCVLRKNGIDLKKVTVIRDISKLRNDDILIAYRHHSDQLYQIEDADCFKVLCFLHFNGNRAEADKLKEKRFNCIYNEADMQKTSQIYNNYYHLNLPWIVHPFVYSERFKNITPFSERKNMAFATGTITYYDHDEFIDTYGDSCDQPSRKQIKINPDFFKDTVFCTSSDYLEDADRKEILPNDNEYIKLLKKIYNRSHQGQQKRYYSFDMVVAFNDYKMCIVGEEILGVPGIGFVEGMACGCAYIGIDSPMYTDVGLIPGKHYITYDGTIEDLKKVIEYYQADEHQQELEEIAHEGCRFVRENFNGEIVAERLIKDLIEQQKQWQESRKKE